MLIVDASVLFELVADTPKSEDLRSRLAHDPDHAEPHLIDAEVLSVIQSQHRAGALDATAATQAVDDHWTDVLPMHQAFVVPSRRPSRGPAHSAFRPGEDTRMGCLPASASAGAGGRFRVAHPHFSRRP